MPVSFFSRFVSTAAGNESSSSSDAKNSCTLCIRNTVLSSLTCATSFSSLTGCSPPSRRRTFSSSSVGSANDGNQPGNHCNMVANDINENTSSTLKVMIEYRGYLINFL